MPKLDSTAFEDCYRRVFPLVLAKCRRMLRGDTEATDVAQEVFARLWQQRELVQDPTALTAWLYRASTRLVIDRARHHKLSEASLQHLVSAVGDETRVDSEARFTSRRVLKGVLDECPPA